MRSNFVLLLIFSCFLQTCYGYDVVQASDINDPSLEIINNILPERKSDEPCLVCEEVIGNVISLRRSNGTRDVMKDYLNRLCIVYTDWGPIGCRGLVDIQIDTILFIIDNRKDLKPARFCAIRFQQYGCVDPDAKSWEIPLPPPLPSVVKVNKNINESTAQVLHITDVHYDSQYTPGSNAKCEEPLCCETGVPTKPEDAAGYWGDYNVCDTPWHAIENLMDRVKEKHKNIDWIYFTGDIVDHRSWTTTIQSNTECIRTILQMFAKTFSEKTVFPVLGNHESHPGDYYAPDTIDKSLNVSTQWVLDLSAEEWSRWLPNATQVTIKKGGFYTVLVKPGFRIVGLNSNVCYIANLWLVYDDEDPYNQLQWLVDVLEAAEKTGEKVHILSHVPPGDLTCHKQWSHEFKKIVLRFSDTIAAQFNGHSHADEFKLFFESSNSTEVKNVAYNGASFTTFVGCNPNYRIYEVDNDNMMVTNYDEYSFNITKANQNSHSPPEWFKLYSFKEAYGLADLQLESLGKLYWQMASNDSDNELVEKYYRYMYRDSDVYINEVCDIECKKNLVCLIAAAETNQSNNC